MPADGGSGGMRGAQSEAPALRGDEYADWALDTQVGTGKFHLIYIVLLGLAYGLPSAHTYADMFVRMSGENYNPKWHWRQVCGEDDMASCPELFAPDNCSSVPHEQWTPDEIGRSIVADFDLICERDYKVPLLASIYFAAFGVGLLVCGQISDTMGRKTGYLVSASAVAAGGFLAPAAQSWTMYAAARALLGFGVAGVGNTTFVWLTEYLNPTLRPLMAWVPNAFFCLAQMLPSALGYTIHGWRQLLLVVNLITITGLLYAPCLDESPRWLALQGEDQKAYAVVRQMAACNGVPQPPPPAADDATEERVDEVVMTGLLTGQSKASSGVEAAAGGCVTVCKQLCSRQLRVRFLFTCISWFSVCFAFYGLGLFAPNLPFDAYAANAVNALVALPFYVVGQPLIGARWCGRKGAVVGGFLVGGAGLLLSTFVSQTVISMVIFYAANGALCLAFGVIYVWSSELFPTNMRGRVMSYVSVAARLGAILAPYVVNLGKTNPELALTIFAVPCLVSGALDLMLPETRGRMLPNTFADVLADAAKWEEGAESDDEDDDDDEDSSGGGS